MEKLTSFSVFGESNNVELEQKTDQTTTDIEIKKRPWRFRVEVSPLAGSYIGIKKEEEIYIAERVPAVSPTEVKVIVHAHNQVHIRFKPIPNIALYGEDKGCKVEVCEKENIQACMTVIAQPQTGEVKLERLQSSKAYSVRAACSTNIGFGPYSNWIAFDNAATTIEQTKKKTTKKAISERVKQDDDPMIELEMHDGFNLIITWNFKTSDGSNYDLKLIKKFFLRQFVKERGAEFYTNKTLVSDASLKEYSFGVTFLLF
ncbi:unnamed protein product [Cylicocyclus nassatus]|uniref:Fibronectin type-III domain-containing protein n=1 Tax=Cylicocyclus nassatus TaxID=53992 RepID=A0AA36GP26_CYLNA|nr:unnamed protein product [Cylicocyclus nassatus]